MCYEIYCFLHLHAFTFTFMLENDLSLCNKKQPSLYLKTTLLFIQTRGKWRTCSVSIRAKIFINLAYTSFKASKLKMP